LKAGGNINMVTKKDVEKVLKDIPDPEIGVSLWDLGLIYNIKIDKKSGKVEIIMTLTTVGCPLFEQIANPIRDAVGKLKGVKSVEVTLTFEPPWTVDRMSAGAKTQLGFA
jgi:metal-sulfur cluster biosynthetic enzyme